ncbi:MAG: hypothetical protein DIU80_021270 [Chloroflexota bacterium]|nr:MAG: hypothetical protein DIU80_10300 [Chloroflexota bacterium]
MVLPQETLVLLIIILIVTILTLLHHARVLSGTRSVSRRPIAALDLMRRALALGAETGRAIHLSPGSGAVGARATTAETIAGLLAAERVATEAALNGAPILASSGDAVAHLALRGTLRQAYQRAGLGQDYDPANVQLLAHQDPMAYASGVTTLYGRQRLQASQLVGSFGQEFMLAGEVGAQRDIPQLAGATTTTALPLVYLTAEGALIGEEIYAAEAYLARAPAPQARLLTQDALRTVAIVAIVVLVLLSAAGIRFAL